MRSVGVLLHSQANDPSSLSEHVDPDDLRGEQGIRLSQAILWEAGFPICGAHFGGWGGWDGCEWGQGWQATLLSSQCTVGARVTVLGVAHAVP